jgi:hypothetical protein
MAIVRDRDFEGEEFSKWYAHVPVGSNCFHCGEKLSLPCVMWNGSHPVVKNEWFQIWLHPECVEDLFRRLLRDAQEILAGDAQAATTKLLRWKAEHGK